MNRFFLNTFSKTMNAYLKLDPESKQRIQPLIGKTISIEFLPFKFIFKCVFNTDGVQLFSDENENLISETILRGTPIQLLAVMIDKENRQRFFADDITIEGNAELGQHVIALFDQLHIDWEEYSSKLIGDIPAYYLHRFANKTTDWLKNTENSMTQNINEYVHEEKQWLPSREELQVFFSDIDILRMDIDRTEGKIKNLQLLLKEGETK